MKSRVIPLLLMISWRGLLGLGVGLLFLYMAVNPEMFGDDAPPIAFRAIFGLAGLALAAIGIISILFVWKRHRLIKSTRAVAADIYVLVKEDSDSTSYTAQLKLSGAAWAIGIDPDRHGRQFADGKVHKANVWIDPKTQKPFAIAIDGKQINTMPTPIEINIADFGRSS